MEHDPHRSRHLLARFVWLLPVVGALACIDTSVFDQEPAQGPAGGYGPDWVCPAVVSPLCADPPEPWQACNPVCQTGCACGRCTVVGGELTCVSTLGTKKLGDACDTTSDQCSPGLVCSPEPCGSNLGRCRKFCDANSACGDGIACTRYPLANPVSAVCEDFLLGTYSCDPVNNTGCPAPFMCSPLSNGTTCTCPGSVPVGGQCQLAEECSPGTTCIGTPATAACQPLCEVAAPNCPPSAPVCISFSDGRAYGFCSGG